MGVVLRKRNKRNEMNKDMQKMYVCLLFGLKMITVSWVVLLKRVGNGQMAQNTTHKKRSFWRSKFFDHLPSFGFGDYIKECSERQEATIILCPPPPFENPGSTTVYR